VRVQEVAQKVMTPCISIAGRNIGPGHPPLIVAELSGNHGGHLERALKLMEAAKAAGADALKLQTYTADTMTIDLDAPDFQIKGGLWNGRALYDLYREAHTPWEWHESLFEKGKELGLIVFSTPFDTTATDFLETLDTPCYKIASFEIVDLPLIAYVARKGKPMIISTGMANLSEIQDALNAARKSGCEQIVLLHCVSSYPAPISDANVRTLPHLGETFSCIAGLSDHTQSSAAAVASIALGGCMVEKHFTLARADGGPDAAFSLEPEEFKRLVDDCKNAWRALGHISYEVESSEQGSLVFRRSIYVVADIKSGEQFNRQNVRIIRPGYGLAPKHLPTVLGQRAARDLKRGERLDWSDVQF